MPTPDCLPCPIGYYSEDGEGPALVLLHGGLVGSETWGKQVPALAAQYRVYLPDRTGHGRTPDVEGPITYDLMAAETIEFVQDVVGEPAHLVGWSDGGILGLIVAMRRPDLVRRLVVIGTNFHYDGMIPGSGFGEEGTDPMGEAVAAERALHGASSVDGPEHWPVFYEKIARLWREEPTLTTDDVATIAAPTLVLSGDDEPTHLAHTVALYEALPAGQLAIVPGTSHMAPLEKPDLVNELILDFLAEEALPKTMAPVRRR